jgi:hypothetical protein
LELAALGLARGLWRLHQPLPFLKKSIIRHSEFRRVDYQMPLQFLLTLNVCTSLIKFVFLILI